MNPKAAMRKQSPAARTESRESNDRGYPMSKQLFLIPIVAVTSLLLGCGQSKLDARQLDWSNDLAYQHGNTTPFTGTVEWNDRVPRDLAAYWKNATGTDLASVASSCETQYANGVPGGLSTCSTAGGQKLFEVTYKNEQYDGVSKFFNATSGKLNREISWTGGKLDGTVEIYTNDGKQLLQRVSWKNGVEDGPVKTWTEGGDVLTDAVWREGKPAEGKVVDSKCSCEYKDGALDGPSTWTGPNGDVIARGSFVHGKRDGAWEDWGESASNLIFGWSHGQGVLVPTMQINNFSIDGITHVTSAWTNGDVEGDVRAFGSQGNLRAEFHAHNNEIEGPFQYVSTSDMADSVSFTNGVRAPSSPTDRQTSAGQQTTP